MKFWDEDGERKGAPGRGDGKCRGLGAEVCGARMAAAEEPE